MVVWNYRNDHRQEAQDRGFCLRLPNGNKFLNSDSNQQEAIVGRKSKTQVQVIRWWYMKKGKYCSTLGKDRGCCELTLAILNVVCLLLITKQQQNPTFLSTNIKAQIHKNGLAF